MGEMIDTIYWWVGAAVVWGVGAGAVTALIAALYALILAAFSVYIKKVFNGVVNWRAVQAWDMNGRPEWKQVDGTFRMVPSKAKSE